MDLAALAIFRAVVRENGVTRAAAKLNRVQSNVTTRIKQLEEELGAALFVRDGRRLVLTPAGHTLLPYAERLLAPSCVTHPFWFWTKPPPPSTTNPSCASSRRS